MPALDKNLNHNAGFMLGQRRRRWTNIKPTLGENLNHNAGFMLGQRHRRWANMKPALGKNGYMNGWEGGIWHVVVYSEKV